MPYKRKYKKRRFRGSGRARGYKRKSKRKRINSVIVRGPSMTADKYLCKLKFVEQLSVAPASTHQIKIFHRMNSVFDPDGTGSGAQPQGFDELAVLYNRYRVFSSAYKLHVNNTTAGIGLNIVLYPSTNSTVKAVSSALSSPYAKHVMLGSPGGIDRGMIKSYSSLQSIRGQSNVTTDMDFTGAVTGNPSRQAYWDLVIETADSTTFLTCEIIIQITYYVEFTDRKQLALS